MRIERLNENNVEAYIIYLKKAMSIEPDMMTAEKIDEDGIRKRIMDSFGILGWPEEVTPG